MTTIAPAALRAPNGRPARRLSARRFVEGPVRIVPLSVDQYHRMIETGVLLEGEPIELLDGLLVRKDRGEEGEDPMMVGPDHVGAVDRLTDLRPKFRRAGCWLRVQAPVTLPPDDEPEPDGAVVRGGARDYRGRHPGAGEILCAIEVSDSSLGQDRTTKQRIYADHGIPQYVLINLVERVVEVYTDPLVGQGRYARVLILGAKQRVEFNIGRKEPLAVPARHLLP